jgi:hypothetical protein
MRTAWQITKATNTQSEYVILPAFQWQQLPCERASMLRLYQRFINVDSVLGSSKCLSKKRPPKLKHKNRQRVHSTQQSRTVRANRSITIHKPKGTLNQILHALTRPPEDTDDAWRRVTSTHVTKESTTVQGSGPDQYCTPQQLHSMCGRSLSSLYILLSATAFVFGFCFSARARLWQVMCCSLT